MRATSTTLTVGDELTSLTFLKIQRLLTSFPTLRFMGCLHFNFDTPWDPELGRADL